jgi:glycosyltransferase involved in cell wall biosynthesis
MNQTILNLNFLSGICRAELLVAHHLLEINHNIKFFVGKDNEIRELNAEEMSIIKSDDPIKAYEEYLKKNKKDHVSTKSGETTFPALDRAYNTSGSRMRRYFEFIKLLICGVPLASPLIFIIGLVGTIPMALWSFMFWITNESRNITRKLGLNAIKFEEAPSKRTIKHPFNDGDVLFVMGWIILEVESAFSCIRRSGVDIKVVNIIYDTAILNTNTTSFLDAGNKDTFLKSFTTSFILADHIIFGGKNAMIDSYKHQEAMGLPFVPGTPLKWGSDISTGEVDINKLCEKNNINKRFILLVGNEIGHKNYDSIYKAFVILSQRMSAEELPSVVICAKYILQGLELDIKSDPNVAQHFVQFSPNDDELNTLYKHCLFFVHPSVAEGWSLTLPEALNHNKCCLVSNIPSLKETGEDFVAYVDRYLDPQAWADKLQKLITSDSLRREYEQKVKEKWKNTTWYESTVDINNVLVKVQEQVSSVSYKQNVWYCLNLIADYYVTALNGIIKADLMILKYLLLNCKNLNLVYFDSEKGAIEIDVSLLDELKFANSETNMVQILHNIQDRVNRIKKSGKGTIKTHVNKRLLKDAAWMSFTLIPCRLALPAIQKITNKNIDLSNKNNQIENDVFKLSPPNDKFIESMPFKKGDIVISLSHFIHEKISNSIAVAANQMGFKYISTIYDFTTTKIPQTHLEYTVQSNEAYFKNVHEAASLVIYGGETAKKDGDEYFSNKYGKVPRGIAVKWGSDSVVTSNDASNDKDMLKYIGVKRQFILAVGTIQERKNYQTLYFAYLDLLERYELEKIPQLIICGSWGWNSDMFYRLYTNDKRVHKGNIIINSFSDEQLDCLYRNCLFTLVPSIYEGWSLTVPESLGYGKFCICSDNAPLREVGQDFVDYVSSFNTQGWADKIMYYTQNSDELKERERYIDSNYHNVTWDECGENILNIINSELDRK